MSNKVLVTNDTNRTQFVSDRMLHPGQSMEVDSHLVPAHLKKSANQEATSGEDSGENASFSPEDLLGQAVKDITPQLPDLDTEQLTALKHQEQQADAPRSSLIDAIDAEILKQAK